MICPKCGNEQSSNDQCEACGIYFQKYEQAKRRRAEQREEEKHGSAGKFVIGAVVVVIVLAGYMLQGSDNKNGPVNGITSLSWVRSSTNFRRSSRKIGGALPLL